MPTSVSPYSPQMEWQLLTAEEFLERLGPEDRGDLVNGELFMHSPASLRHAELARFLYLLISLFVEQHLLGEVHCVSVAVRLHSRHVFMPDIAFFSNEQVGQFSANHVPVTPVFVAEVLSPATAHLDVGPKFVAYEENGVREYWVLDQGESLRHRFYRRENEILVEFAQSGEWIESAAIPGFKVRREWLDPDHAPPVADCLLSMAS